MDPQDIDKIANAVAHSLAGQSVGLLGCGALSSPDEYVNREPMECGIYVCGGAEEAGFGCCAGFACHEDFLCAYPFSFFGLECSNAVICGEYCYDPHTCWGGYKPYLGLCIPLPPPPGS